MSDFSGRVALVTGGANGIGRSIVEHLAARGAAVAVVDRERETGEATAAEVRAAGRHCVAVAGDVTDADRMLAVAEEVRAQLGPVTLLVNNAGINTSSERVAVHQYLARDWRRIMDVDLSGVFHTSRAVIPQMLDEGGGRIVNISSIAGLVPLRLQSAFVSAKAAVVNLTKAMALEYGPLGILVNAVAPGSTLTRGTEALFYGRDGAYNEKAASLVSHISVGRPGTSAEIANGVVFLLSGEASYVNGHVLTIDGGWVTGSVS